MDLESRKKKDGIRKKKEEEGRKEEGRRKKEEGRKEEGRRKKKEKKRKMKNKIRKKILRRSYSDSPGLAECAKRSAAQRGRRAGFLSKAARVLPVLFPDSSKAKVPGV